MEKAHSCETCECEEKTMRNVPSAGAKKVFTGRLNQIPDDIRNDPALNAAIAQLPINYNFEIHKTVWRVRTEKAAVVALQFPEGLLMYSCIIADILRSFCNVDVIILGDVTYGACCVDDLTPRKLRASFLVHYGHSCLVPMNELTVKVLYVFVEIFFDVSHLVEVLHAQFHRTARLVLMGTIQFSAAIHEVSMKLKSSMPNCLIGQAKPLSQSETLGCTSPILPECDALIFIADGRFHLEAAMIQNPTVPAYRYDPYAKQLTSERYDTEKMRGIRWSSIERAKSCKTFGLILGTLGRQGSLGIFARIKKNLEDSGRTVIPFLMAEINPLKLQRIVTIDVWVQVACPRLSIDWSGGFDRPILTPYECEVMLGSASWGEVYPMDYYSNAGGTWGNMYHRKPQSKKVEVAIDS
jgi:2-(3-amino-3-carboxypropyl)histidine synthase